MPRTRRALRESHYRYSSRRHLIDDPQTGLANCTYTPPPPPALRPPPPPTSRSNHTVVVAVIAVVATIAAAALLVCCCWWWWRRRRAAEARVPLPNIADDLDAEAQRRARIQRFLDDEEDGSVSTIEDLPPSPLRPPWLTVEMAAAPSTSLAPLPLQTAPEEIVPAAATALEEIVPAAVASSSSARASRRFEYAEPIVPEELPSPPASLPARSSRSSNSAPCLSFVAQYVEFVFHQDRPYL